MSLPHIILTVLSTRDVTGYDITKEFSNSIGYFWKASHQQVYRELNKLLEQGAVECHIVPQQGKPDRKVYSITDRGHELLNDWFKQSLSQPVFRDEFSAKLVACSVCKSDAMVSHLESLIAESRNALSQYEEIELRLYANPAQLDTRSRLERLTLRRGIYQQQAWLNWAEEALGELNSINAERFLSEAV
ncbi:PadR family transcriptional regulator [Parasalinivibrio latis]|uniref:PadR family transcriptional regulator n=1 Tax=Parasalinivibrio latis TaxID=2952610 RepID=UPI0030E48B0C